MSNSSVKLTAGTNVGLVRTNNEDNFTVNIDLTHNDWLIPSDSQAISLGEYGALLVVADGMGGMNAGEVASEIAVNTIEDFFSIEDFSPIIDTEQHIAQFLTSAIVKADEAIRQHVIEEPETEGMGTTIVMAWVLRNRVHIAWCGDSRAYKFNKTSGLTRLSKDHSYVQQLVDEGALPPEEAFDFLYSNIITRSLGDTNSVVKPDYKSFPLADGDNIILCSDGLCGICRDAEILEAMNNMDLDNITACRDALIKMALDAGGDDNVTVAILQYQTSDNVEDFLHTVMFKSKPLYKKKLFYIPVLIIALIVTPMLLPDKWIGEKGVSFRTELKSWCATSFDKSKNISAAPTKNEEHEATVITSEEFVESENLQSEDVLENNCSEERYGDLAEIRDRNSAVLAEKEKAKEKKAKEEAAKAQKQALKKLSSAVDEVCKAAKEAKSYADAAKTNAQNGNIEGANSDLNQAKDYLTNAKGKNTDVVKYAKNVENAKSKSALDDANKALKEAEEACNEANDAISQAGEKRKEDATINKTDEVAQQAKNMESSVDNKDSSDKSSNNNNDAKSGDNVNENDITNTNSVVTLPTDDTMGNNNIVSNSTVTSMKDNVNDDVNTASNTSTKDNDKDDDIISADTTKNQKQLVENN